MTMPCSIAGDMSIGHAGFSPSPVTPSTANILVMGAPPHVAGDIIGPHVLGLSVHVGTVIGSTTVLTLKGTKGLILTFFFALSRVLRCFFLRLSILLNFVCENSRNLFAASK